MSIALQGASLRTGAATLLDAASCSFEAGRVCAVLGPNGAGKSSLLSLASGQRKPSAGLALLDGQALGIFTPGALARRRAVVSQETAVAFEFTVHDIVSLGRYPHRLKPATDEPGIVAAALAATGVLNLQGRIYNTLSGGEKARVQLARAMAQIWERPAEGGSRWLLLDEPTAALDLAHQHQVMGRVRSWAHTQAVGVVAVLHDLNLALRYADDVLVLSQARCRAAGPVQQTISVELVQEVWGIGCHAGMAPDGVPHYVFSGAPEQAAA